jgi:hypothetical protein
VGCRCSRRAPLPPDSRSRCPMGVPSPRMNPDANALGLGRLVKLCRIEQSSLAGVRGGLARSGGAVEPWSRHARTLPPGSFHDVAPHLLTGNVVAPRHSPGSRFDNHWFGRTSYRSPGCAGFIENEWWNARSGSTEVRCARAAVLPRVATTLAREELRRALPCRTAVKHNEACVGVHAIGRGGDSSRRRPVRSSVMLGAPQPSSAGTSQPTVSRPERGRAVRGNLPADDLGSSSLRA